MENGGIVGDCRQVVKKGDFFSKIPTREIKTVPIFASPFEIVER